MTVRWLSGWTAPPLPGFAPASALGGQRGSDVELPDPGGPANDRPAGRALRVKWPDKDQFLATDPVESPDVDQLIEPQQRERATSVVAAHWPGEI